MFRFNPAQSVNWREFRNGGARVCRVIIIQSKPYFIIDIVKTRRLCVCEVMIVVRLILVVVFVEYSFSNIISR